MMVNLKKTFLSFVSVEMHPYLVDGVVFDLLLHELLDLLHFSHAAPHGLGLPRLALQDFAVGFHLALGSVSLLLVLSDELLIEFQT